MKKEKKPMSKKKKIAVLSVLSAVLLIAAVCVTVTLVQHARVTTMLGQQNWVAAKLLEMGSYEDGRVLAMKTEQARSNDISRTLIVLSAGFSADYDGGLAVAESYLADGGSSVIAEVRDVIANARSAYGDAEANGGYMSSGVYYVLDDATRDALLAILLRVEGDIKVKKNAASVQAMQELLSTGTIQTVSQEDLEKDGSLLSKKVQMLSSMKRGEYNTAFEAAEALFSADSSFSNRALLANLVATGNVSLGEDDGAADKYQQKLNALYTELDEANMAYYEMLENAYDEKKQKTMYDEILRIEGEIESQFAAMVREPVKRAINFIETTTPRKDKKTAAYRIELANLYWLAGNINRAAQLLVEELTRMEITVSVDPIADAMASIVSHYRSVSGGAGRTEERRSIWNRVASVLGIIENGYDGYGTDDTFFGFLEDMLDRIYKGLTIRSIDASNFPTVRVTVNAATDDGGNLGKNDFIVEDMQQKIGSLRLLDAQDLEIAADMSVMLVVDRSGSMGGEPMENTKAAVANFVRSTDERVALGLVAFESWAELITPLGASRTQLLSAIDAIYETGGTNIKDGLALAGTQLEGIPGRRIIILISDGSDGSPEGIDEVLETLRLNNICVYTIAFGGADTNYLSYIADATGGKFLQSDSSAGLTEIYSSIGEYMVNDYVLEFEAKTSLEDFSRELHIELAQAHAVADSAYNVGVSYQDILDEQTLSPAYNAYRQTGGSARAQ